MGKYIYLLIGESGSGKTTIADRLSSDLGLKQLWSYTTRKPRYDGERGHIFVDELDPRAKCVAYTKFDGNHYWATQQQIEENDVYVVDPDGLLYFMLRYDGEKIPVVFFIDTTTHTRRKRLRKRGDSRAQIRQRIRHDKIAFKTFRESFRVSTDRPYLAVDVDNNDGDEGYEKLADFIRWLDEEGNVEDLV